MDNSYGPQHAEEIGTSHLAISLCCDGKARLTRICPSISALLASRAASISCRSSSCIIRIPFGIRAASLAFYTHSAHTSQHGRRFKIKIVQPLHRWTLRTTSGRTHALLAKPVSTDLLVKKVLSHLHLSLTQVCRHPAIALVACYTWA